MCHLIRLQRLLVFEAADDREVDRVVVRRFRGQCAGEDKLTGGRGIEAEGIAKRELVLGQGCGLVGAQHVYARQFLDRDQLAYDRLFLCQEARADRHGHRQNGRHRDGNRRNGQHERNCSRVRIGSPR